jgi:hypothetical protein
MKNRKFDKKKYLLLILSPLLALVSFVITYYIDPLNYGQNASMAAIPAFLLSIIILIIGQIIAIHNEVEQVSTDSERIYETVKNYLNVTKLGTPQSAWKYIIDKLSILEYVQNTSFNFADEYELTDERLYDGDTYQQSFNRISKYINKGLCWKDVGDSSAIERFRKINNLISNNSKGHYYYRLIQQSEPQIGFILLTYKDGTKEVLFNWDFRDIPQDPVVLLSRDEEIFNMFAAQYKSLWRVAVIDYDNNATKSTS